MESTYFSIRYRHGAYPYVKRDRRILESLDQENAVLYLIHTWAFMSASIQRSWLSARAPSFRFEEITENPTATFRTIFVQQCGLTIPSTALDERLARHHFSPYSGARDQG